MTQDSGERSGQFIRTQLRGEEIFEVEQKSMVEVQKSFAEPHHLTEEARHLILRALSLLKNVEVTDDLHRLTVLLVLRSFNSLRVAQLSIELGYPLQAQALVRTLFEDRQCSIGS
jgi:hypothetical protein